MIFSLERQLYSSFVVPHDAYRGRTETSPCMTILLLIRQKEDETTTKQRRIHLVRECAVTHTATGRRRCTRPVRRSVLVPHLLYRPPSSPSKVVVASLTWSCSVCSVRARPDQTRPVDPVNEFSLSQAEWVTRFGTPGSQVDSAGRMDQWAVAYWR